MAESLRRLFCAVKRPLRFKIGGKSAAAAKLMAIMGLGIKQGDTVSVTVEGGREDANAAAMEQFFKDNL